MGREIDTFRTESGKAEGPAVVEGMVNGSIGIGNCSSTPEVSFMGDVVADRGSGVDASGGTVCSMFSLSRDSSDGSVGWGAGLEGPASRVAIGGTILGYSGTPTVLLAVCRAFVWWLG